MPTPSLKNQGSPLSLLLSVASSDAISSKFDNSESKNKVAPYNLRDPFQPQKKQNNPNLTKPTKQKQEELRKKQEELRTRFKSPNEGEGDNRKKTYPYNTKRSPKPKNKKNYKPLQGLRAVIDSGNSTQSVYSCLNAETKDSYIISKNLPLRTQLCKIETLQEKPRSMTITFFEGRNQKSKEINFLNSSQASLDLKALTNNAAINKTVTNNGNYIYKFSKDGLEYEFTCSSNPVDITPATFKIYYNNNEVCSNAPKITIFGNFTNSTTDSTLTNTTNSTNTNPISGNTTNSTNTSHPISGNTTNSTNTNLIFGNATNSTNTSHPISGNTTNSTNTNLIFGNATNSTNTSKPISGNTTNSTNASHTSPYNTISYCNYSNNSLNLYDKDNRAIGSIREVKDKGDVVGLNITNKNGLVDFFNITTGTLRLANGTIIKVRSDLGLYNLKNYDEFDLVYDLHNSSYLLKTKDQQNIASCQYKIYNNFFDSNKNYSCETNASNQRFLKSDNSRIFQVNIDEKGGLVVYDFKLKTNWTYDSFVLSAIEEEKNGNKVINIGKDLVILYNQFTGNLAFRYLNKTVDNCPPYRQNITNTTNSSITHPTSPLLISTTTTPPSNTITSTTPPPLNQTTLLTSNTNPSTTPPPLDQTTLLPSNTNPTPTPSIKDVNYTICGNNTLIIGNKEYKLLTDDNEGGGINISTINQIFKNYCISNLGNETAYGSSKNFIDELTKYANELDQIKFCSEIESADDLKNLTESLEEIASKEKNEEQRNELSKYIDKIKEFNKNNETISRDNFCKEGEPNMIVITIMMSILGFSLVALSGYAISDGIRTRQIRDRGDRGRV